MKWFSPTFVLTQALLAQAALKGSTAAPPGRPPPAAAGGTPGSVTVLEGMGLADAGRQPAPAGHFRPPPPVLAPADAGLLCASVRDGIARYVDLQAEALRLSPVAGGDGSVPADAARRAANAFPARFRIVYREGRQARARAAAALERYRLAEDDPIHDESASSPARTKPRRPVAARPAGHRQADADLRVFEQRRQGVDRFFRELRTTRLALYAAIPPDAPPHRAVAARAFVRAQLATAVDRARSPLADGLPPLPYAPDTDALRRRLSALVRPRETTTAMTIPAPTPAATAPTTGPPPLPDNRQRNLAIGEINRFYASDSGQLMGTRRNTSLPNAPEIASLGIEGVVTFIGPKALANALRFGPRAHRHSNPAVSTRWKYGSQSMVDADRHDRIPIKKVRYEVSGGAGMPPYRRYAEIRLRGDYFQVGDGAWQLTGGFPLDETLEQAKYLRITALIEEASRRHAWIVNHENHDPRDFTGLGWWLDLVRWLDFSNRRRTP